MLLLGNHTDIQGLTLRILAKNLAPRKRWEMSLELPLLFFLLCVIVVQLPSHIRLFATPMDCSTPGFPVLHHLTLCRPLLLCLQSFPASEFFPISQLFASGGQSIGTLAAASVPPMNIQGWFPIGWTGWISLESKGLSRVFSNTTVQKHQLFITQPSLWSHSQTHWQNEEMGQGLAVSTWRVWSEM